LSVPKKFCDYYIELANSTLNNDFAEKLPLIFLFTALLPRTLSKYKNGLSLIWRDAGALITTISLVAEGLQLSSCPLGFSKPLINSDSFGIDEGDAWVMGGMVIGDK